MKPESTLIAERSLAQHSELLATRPPETGALAKALAARAARLESALADGLAELLGGARPTITCGKVEKAASPKLHKIVDPVAANVQLQGNGGVQVLASLDYHSALALTDQMFGGAGNWASAKPEKLPGSANLTIGRFAAMLGTALATVFDLPDPLAVAARSDVLGKFITARDNDTFLVLRAEVAVDEGKAWSVLLVWRQAHVAKLLDDGGGTPPPSRGAGDRRRPDAKPFADVPLPLTAVLAHLQLPVSRITEMQAGDTIPLALGRNIALRLADTEIARGEVGACDGALALRLTSIAWNSPMKGQDHDG